MEMKPEVTWQIGPYKTLMIRIVAKSHFGTRVVIESHLADTEELKRIVFGEIRELIDSLRQAEEFVK